MLVKPIHTFALMIMVFSRCDTFTPPTAKLDVQADVLLYIGLTDFDTLRKEILDVFPSYYEMAEDKVRIGAWCVNHSSQSTKIVGLTGNITHFIEVLQEFNPTGQEAIYDFTIDYLDDTKIFKDTGRSGIPKVVHRTFSHRVGKISSNYIPSHNQNAKDLKYPCHTSFKVELTGIANYVEGCGRVGEELMNMLCGKRVRQLAHESCTFDKSGACIKYGSGIIQIDPLECSKFPDLKPKPCDKAQCDQFCDDYLQWPNIIEDCAGICGNITIQRNRTSNLQALQKMYSRCPTKQGPVEEKEAECVCTEKPLTQTSVSPSTQQKSFSGVSPKTVSTTKVVQKTSYTPAAKPKSTTGDVSESVSKTAAVPKAAGQGTQPTHPSSSTNFPWWIIGVVAGVVVIALLGVVSAVVISRRRRMQKNPARAAVEMSAPVPTPKRKVVVKGRKGVGAAVGGENGAAKGEECVGVSLKEDLTTKRQKPTASTIKSSSKGESHPPKKDNNKKSGDVSKMAKGTKVGTGSKKA